MTKFDEVVDHVARRIGQGRVLLSERVRAGRRRQISLGPHRVATSTKRQYALCVLPALPGEDDCKLYPSSNRAAREFARLVGVEEAKDALVRESQKSGGGASPISDLSTLSTPAPALTRPELTRPEIERDVAEIASGRVPIETEIWSRMTGDERSEVMRAVGITLANPSAPRGVAALRACATYVRSHLDKYGHILNR